MEITLLYHNSNRTAPTITNPPNRTLCQLLFRMLLGLFRSELYGIVKSTRGRYFTAGGLARKVTLFYDYLISAPVISSNTRLAL